MNQNVLPTPEIELNYKSVICACDGHLILTKTNGAIDLAFLQFNKPGQPVADVVAAVRLGNVEELKRLKKSIDEHLEKEENKEK